jgi:hypothetical protein
MNLSDSRGEWLLRALALYGGLCIYYDAKRIVSKCVSGLKTMLSGVSVHARRLPFTENQFVFGVLMFFAHYMGQCTSPPIK